MALAAARTGFVIACTARYRLSCYLVVVLRWDWHHCLVSRQPIDLHLLRRWTSGLAWLCFEVGELPGMACLQWWLSGGCYVSCSLELLLWLLVCGASLMSIVCGFCFILARYFVFLGILIVAELP